MKGSNKMNRSTEFEKMKDHCKNVDFALARTSLTNHGLGDNDDKIESARQTIGILIARHNDLANVEEFIAQSPVLMKYYVQAQNEVTRANNFSMATIFITALEKISEVLLEYEQSTERETPDEELVRLRKENKELNEKLDEIAEIFRKCDAKYAK